MPPFYTVETIQAQLKQRQAIQALEALCVSQSITPYYVGGVVRDGLMSGILSIDIDVVLPQPLAKQIAQALAQTISGRLVVLDPHYDIYRVIVKDEAFYIDIAACVGADIQTDLLRRDFTMNAMAFSLQTPKLLDPTGGFADLQNRQVRMVHSKNLLDDPLRFLRAFRIAAEGGYAIAPQTLEAIAASGYALARVAVERIQAEINRLFSAPRCAQVIHTMAETGLLEVVFPELSAMHPIPGNNYHHLPLWLHTLALLTQAEYHFADLPPPVQSALKEPFLQGLTRLGVTRLSCLLHDVGKPATMTYDPIDDRYRFYTHDFVSARITEGIAYRLKWGTRLTQAVTELVRWHLYPGDIVKPDVTLKAYRKFFHRIGNQLSEMMLLALADRFSAQGPAVSPAELIRFKAGIVALWDKKAQLEEAGNVVNHHLLSGRQVMSLLNIQSGPNVGHMLRQVQIAYLDGLISTEAEAIRYLQTLV